jgi:prepilin-type N-terminal cleavage/methylation domain-containing protein
MTFAARLRARLRDERGFTLIELLASMTILMTVMGGLTALMVSGTASQVEMNRRFQAQTEARLGLDRMRRDIHCSSSVSPAGASATVTLTMSSTCPTSGGGTSITWCTVANGTGRYGLWRYLGSACSGTGLKVADYLTTQNAFSYTAPTVGSLELMKLGVTLAVNLTPTKPGRVYTLTDDIVLRNSARA